VRTNRPLLIVLLFALVAEAGVLAFLMREAEVTKRKLAILEKLMECDPSIVGRVRDTIADLEAIGFKPSIKAAWRSAEEQGRAFYNGRSDLRFGFHNLTGDHGERRAFSVDLVEDVNRATTSPRFALTLAFFASRHHMRSGVLWGLNERQQQAVISAIANRTFDSKVEIGWDPCHLEPDDMSLAEAMRLLAGPQ
jgi:hypothetical protein